MGKHQTRSIDGRQAAAARALLGLDQSEVAACVGFKKVTLGRFERRETVLNSDNMAALIEFYEQRGIFFLLSGRINGVIVLNDDDD